MEWKRINQCLQEAVKAARLYCNDELESVEDGISISFMDTPLEDLYFTTFENAVKTYSELTGKEVEYEREERGE